MDIRRKLHRLESTCTRRCNVRLPYPKPTGCLAFFAGHPCFALSGIAHAQKLGDQCAAVSELGQGGLITPTLSLKNLVIRTYRWETP